MCGLTGFLTFSQPTHYSLESIVSKMNNTLITRGPDSAGTWTDIRQGVALAHRRLAIQDLSPAGHQPMLSASGRYVMVFNGEIYNHLDLRKALELNRTYNWNGHSDTETILACIEAWGFEKSLTQLTGMFAIALWDNELNKLFIARDRLGEKPLYYAQHNDVFMFSSELKALKKHPDFITDIDRDVLCLYLRHNCVPAPYCIYKNTFKVMPGTLLSIDLKQSIMETTYWSVSDVIASGRLNKFEGTVDDAVNQLDTLLTKAVTRQVISDVPLGAFLSGGVDSSAVVALMQANTSKPVKTFTMGFDSKAYNEAEHAKAVAKHLGTEHTEMYVTPKDAMDVIPSLHYMYDEPFADSSQIPTFLVSKLAKQHVTVALSGDGGDELFAGYNRHQLAHTLWPKVNKMPLFLRKLTAAGITQFSPSQLDSLSYVLPKQFKMRLLGDKLHKAAAVLSARDTNELYLGLVSQWKSPENIVLGGVEPNSLITHSGWDNDITVAEKMMALDMQTYMPDDILTKVDRAAMAISLETRVPMLDHSVVEFAWQLPLDIKLRNGVTKWPLREVLYKYVPKSLIERPKMGFGIPLDNWLRGPLKDWASELLSPIRLQREGFFNEASVTKVWDEHLLGKHNHTQQLWCILMFQTWLENES